jgi:PAS domain S-box-containing protein
MPESELPKDKRSLAVPFRLAWVVTLIGVVVLFGWAFDISRLKSVFPGLASMKANTALGLLLCGASLTILSGKRIGDRARVIAAVVAIIAATLGVLTLIEYFAGWDFRIDNALFQDGAPSVETAAPGRMSPATALCLALTGAALVITARRAPVRLWQSIVAGLSASVIVIAGLALAGYLADGALGYLLWNYTGTPVHTATGLLLLGSALMTLARGEDGLKWMLDRTSTEVFLSAAVLMVLGGAIAYAFTRELRQTGASVSYTQEVLIASGELKTDIANIESGQRGYIITGDKLLFERFRLAKAHALVSLDEVRNLTGDNPDQQFLLNQIEPLIIQQIELADKTIATRDQQGLSAAQQSLASGTGIALSNDSYALLQRAQDEERSLLGKRKSRSDAVSVTTFLVLPMGLFLSLSSLFLGVFLLNAGVGEQTRARQAASDSEARLAGIVNSAMDAIITVDVDQRIVLFNGAAEKIFRCAAKDVMGQPIDMFVPKPSRDNHRRHIQGFGIAGVTSRSMHSLGMLTALRADGGEFPIEASISQIEAAGQKFFTVILRDITERETMDAERRQFVSLAENSVEFIGMCDLQGAPFFVNEAGLRLLGLKDLEQAMRTPVREFFFPSDQEFIIDEFLPRVRSEGHGEVEVRFRHFITLEAIWMVYNVFILRDSAGEPTAFATVSRNISERKLGEEVNRQLNAELEERVLERTNELETANKELDAFSYSVSHDLRAPLRAVDGFSQAVVEDYGPLLPEEGRRHLRIIRESAQRMGDLIDDLLTFSRLSRQPLATRSVDQAKLVRGVLEELSKQLDGREVEVRIQEMPRCDADPALLKQVWVNLLSNALKFTGKRAKTDVEIGSVREKGEDVFFIRDNGTGFDMKYAGKLFGVFQRLHRTEEFDGTGVGLAIVQRIVHRHGGRIWAEAAVDRGATFFFTLRGEPYHD